MQGRGPFVYAAIAVLIVVVAAAAYLILTFNAKTQATFNIYNNLSNSTYNRTQLMLLGNLKGALNITNLHVTYSASRTGSVLAGNQTLIVVTNQTIDSYRSGSYNKSIYTDALTYTYENGTIYAKNVSSIYYYETNMTVTCINQSSTDSHGNASSNLRCTRGTGGLYYLNAFPFTASNISALGVLTVEGNLTYTGIRTISSRNCNEFTYSNITHANLLSNYSVIGLCLDSEYGVPLYINETYIVDGTPESTISYMATRFDTNVQNSDFTIPQSYIDSASKSVI